MENLEWLTILREYGTLGLLIVFILKDVWPRVFSQYSRVQQKHLDQKIEEMRAEREIEAAANEEDRNERTVEREFRHDMDIRQANQTDELIKISRSQGEVMIRMSAQLEQISKSQASLSTYLVEAISRMREKIARSTSATTGPLDFPASSEEKGKE
jgi:hypothetical protein